HSPLILLTLPGAILIGFAFAAVGMAATSFMRTWQDFDLIQLVVLPMFLFSGTFFPLDSFPEPARILIQLTPLYHGVDLLRTLAARGSSSGASERPARHRGGSPARRPGRGRCPASAIQKRAS